MRIERTIVALVVLQVGGVLGVSEVSAQELAQPPQPNPVIPLERAGGAPTATDRAPLPSGQARRPPILPSRQEQNFRDSGGNAAIARLHNPFDWGDQHPQRGIFGPVSPQYQPTPYPTGPGVAPAPPAPGLEGVPGYAPGMPAPGVEAAPGMGAAPGAPGAGAEAAPGLAAPGAPSPAAAAAGAAALEAAAGTAGPGFGGGLGAASEAFPMIGDRGPLFLRQNLRQDPRFPPIPTPIPPPGTNSASLTARSVAAIVPAIRGFKIADNQYPRPVDRVWVSFNYYDGVNSGLNSELGAPIKNMQVYNEIFGFEKTFLDQQASIGFRIPVNTLTITSAFPGLSGSHSSTGNFSSFFKYVLWQDNRGNLISGGVDLSFPTGPTTFAGYPTNQGIKAFEFQPFLGYIYQHDRYYLQGFSSIAVPTDRNLATMYYFDIAVGYYVYRSQNPRALISAIVPVFETHLNIPLNWAGFQPRYLGSTPDVVDLTWGLNLGLASRAVLSAAYIHPVTGPTPFSGELALMLNVPFGGRPGRNIPLTPPVIGQ